MLVSQSRVFKGFIPFSASLSLLDADGLPKALSSSNFCKEFRILSTSPFDLSAGFELLLLNGMIVLIEAPTLVFSSV